MEVCPWKLKGQVFDWVVNAFSKVDANVKAKYFTDDEWEEMKVALGACFSGAFENPEKLGI